MADKSPLLFKSNIEYKTDGYKNLLSGIGTKRDKTKHTTFDGFRPLDYAELGALYIGDGIGKNIVSAPADDMTRNWIEIPNDTDNKIADELYRLDAQNTFNQAIKWARLFGGSIIIMGTNDDADLISPLPVTIRGINWLKVYAISEIPVNPTMIDANPKSSTFGQVSVYDIQPKNATQFYVHASRCIIFKGEPTPDTYRQVDFQTQYWGMSALQPVFERLVNFGASEQSIHNTIQEFIISVFKLSNLAQLLESTDGSTAVYNRMDIISASKSMLHSVLLGEDETFDRNVASFTGLPEILDRLMMFISASTGIPVTKLFGRSAAGMNATGENDLRNYYDMISSLQQTWMRKPVQKLVDTVAGYIMPKTKEKFIIQFPAVWSPSQKETVDMKKVQADTDNIYIQTGVMTAEEVRANRFENGYSFETAVETV